MTTTTSADTLEHTIGLRGQFSLRVPSGDVVVHAIDGEVARVRDLDGRPLAEHFKIVAGDGSLSLRTPDSGINFVLDLGFLRRGGHANLEVELPRLATVQLETASADVNADGLQGSSRFRTASGELLLTGAGGSIDVEAVSGDVSVNADAEVSVGCRTVSGEVTVEAPTIKRLQVTTTSGDVRAAGELVGEGPFAINTVSGSAEVITSSGLRVEAKTVTGDIDAPDLGRADRSIGRRTLVVGSGQIVLGFRSISGDLRVSKPNGHTQQRPVAPVPPVPPTPPVAPVPSGSLPAAEGSEEIDAAADETLAERRLEVLRALERGEISVDETTAKLAELDTELDAEGAR